MGVRLTHWATGYADADVDAAVERECVKGEQKYGKLQSAHEVAAVIYAELQEFWDSIRDHDPDPQELIQIAAVAIRGIKDLCHDTRNGRIR